MLWYILHAYPTTYQHAYIFHWQPLLTHIFYCVNLIYIVIIIIIIIIMIVVVVVFAL